MLDVERLVEEEHPVRAIWELVGQLDLSAFAAGIDSLEGVAGRPRLLSAASGELMDLFLQWRYRI